MIASYSANRMLSPRVSLLRDNALVLSKNLEFSREELMYSGA